MKIISNWQKTPPVLLQVLPHSQVKFYTVLIHFSHFLIKTPKHEIKHIVRASSKILYED